jgi:rubrerythrin
MTIGDAIQTAIEYETKIYAMYKDAAKASGDPTGKKVFAALADEEQYHLDYLKEKLDQWKTSGDVMPGNIHTKVPSSEVIQKGLEEISKQMAARDLDDELVMLKKALAVEIETSNFYEKMTSEMTGAAQEMFARFLEIEKGHQQIVQAEIDAVSGSGFWFDFQEFSMEE